MANSMHAVTQQVTGGPETLKWSTVARPAPLPNEILIKVHATAFNPADAGGREGRFLAPGADPQILGLECAGVIAAIGSAVSEYSVGERVCALLNLGGYAEYVAVHEGMVLRIPDNLSFAEATSLPESLCTVWSNLALTPDPMRSRRILLHGGSGSVGSIAIQMAKLRGDEIFATAGSSEGCDLMAKLGADHTINYNSQDFVEAVNEITAGKGVEQILDIVGGSYFARNIEALSVDGHLAVISVQGGAKVEANLFAMMQKRITLTTTMLKNRPVTGSHSKVEIVEGVKKFFWQAVADGQIKPVIGALAPIQEISRVHEQHKNNELPAGKTVLTVIA